MRWLALLVLVALGGCGGGGPCKAREGAYRVSYVTRSGNCGTVAEQVVAMGPGQEAAEAGPECVGSATVSDDMCEVTLANVVCPGGPGNSVTVNGKADWSQDAKGATATVGVSISETGTGRLICVGSYDVTYTKL